MNTEDLAYLSLREAADGVRRREWSPVELLDAVVAQATALEPDVNAYITRLFDQAAAAARRAEQEIQAGAYRGPLHGIPIAHKDNFWTRGVRSTAGSKILADFVPAEDATVVAKLAAAGAVLTGKLNMHEMALGPTTINPHYGATHNPWRLERMVGGSSGGSAAAVAAGYCYSATGTDTAGSIRIPASYCGTVGLKPTYGRVSIYGVVPFAWTMDHVGPLTRTVEDTALILNAMAGYDSRDRGSAHVPVPDFTADLRADLRGLRLGVLALDPFEPIDREVRGAVEAASGVLGDLGADLQTVDFPLAAQAGSIGTCLARAEAVSFNESFLRTRPDDYGPDVRESLELGAATPALDYLRAQRLRTAVCDQLEALFTRVDALLLPTTRTPAGPIDRPITAIDGRPVRDVFTTFTLPFDLTGSPALSVPCGFSADGLPLALQIVGRAFDEATVLRIGAAYEQATPWHQRRPSLSLVR